jgi:hypothetical protein
MTTKPPEVSDREAADAFSGMNKEHIAMWGNSTIVRDARTHRQEAFLAGCAHVRAELEPYRESSKQHAQTLVGATKNYDRLCDKLAEAEARLEIALEALEDIRKSGEEYVRGECLAEVAEIALAKLAQGARDRGDNGQNV